ncbi:MAG: hypothetical protein AB1847_21990 [bacterium]
MLSQKRKLYSFVLGLLMITGIALLSASYAHAVLLPTATTKNWINLPPYNTLWPLWSPPLSPVNPLTGLATPIVSNLRPSTVLPVQPGLTWDPNLDYPWLLYNTPLGMAYYDPLYGIDTWPPDYLKDAITGLPVPINLSLILGWSSLLPTSTSWLSNNVPVANNSFINAYPAYAVAYEILQGGTLASYPIFASLLNPPPPLQSLLTPALLAGLGALAP